MYRKKHTKIATQKYLSITTTTTITKTQEKETQTKIKMTKKNLSEKSLKFR